MTMRTHLFISGRVQGVSYRAFTRGTALRLGLCGWVRNLPDGRVEAVFEGKSELVDEAITACRTGPAYARVTGVESCSETPQGDREFEVRY